MAVAAQNSRLGRGLASLIGDPKGAEQSLPAEGEQRLVPIDQVQPSSLNPRQDFAKGDLEELANSIQEKGLIQPLIVRPAKNKAATYEIVAGERRWRAGQIAGLHTVPVILRDVEDQELLEIAIIENVQRTDLNVLEEAQGYCELIEKYGYTQEDLGKIIGKSRSHLANTMRLLKLPDSVQKYLRDGRLTAGHARALVGHDDAEELAQKIIKMGLNVRDVEALVQEERETPTSSRKTKSKKDADTRAVEQELSDALGLKVEINPRSRDTGEIRMRYGSLDQFEHIRDRLLQEFGK